MSLQYKIRNLEGAKEQLGERLFYQAQCTSCHIPRQVTGTAFCHAEYNNQVIHLHTDLLLHDMGEGLADNRPDFEANGQEWRCGASVWGKMLTSTRFSSMMVEPVI